MPSVDPTVLRLIVGAGIACVIFEAGLIQTFGIFVGGPTYSLAFALVAVLDGYALGS
jgi:hypothetical protein